METNPFIAEFTCSGCGRCDKKINEFPGGKCLECHAAAFNINDQRRLEDMWRSPGLIN